MFALDVLKRSPKQTRESKTKCKDKQIATLKTITICYFWQDLQIVKTREMYIINLTFQGVSNFRSDVYAFSARFKSCRYYTVQHNSYSRFKNFS